MASRMKVVPLTAGNWTTEEWSDAEEIVWAQRCKYPPESLSAIYRDIAIHQQACLTALKLAATEQATQAEAVLNLRTWKFERKEKELCRTIHDLTRERDDAQTEVEHLRSWKKEMLAVESAWDEQAVGRALDMKWGTSIRPQILPKVNALKSERDALALSQGRLLGALKMMLEHYVSLVNCGDCGNWDPETEEQVQQTRAAIAEATPEGETK